MELSLKKIFPGLAAKRVIAKAQLYDAKKTYENVVVYVSKLLMKIKLILHTQHKNNVSIAYNL